MTISNSIRRAGPYAGDGQRVDYPFVFKVFSASDVSAYVADGNGLERALQQGADYSVTLNPEQETRPGGSVRLTVPLPAGHLMTLTSAMPALQPLEFTNQGGFYPRNLNDALDRLTILVQQMEERIGRALLGSVNSGVPPSLPVAQAGRLLGWNAQGALINVDFESRMESDDSKGGTDKIATAEAVKKVGDKLASAQKTLTRKINDDTGALNQALQAAKQDIANLRHALNAVQGGSAALELVRRITACEQAVQAMGAKVDGAVNNMTTTLAKAERDIRADATARLKKLRTLALAGL